MNSKFDVLFLEEAREFLRRQENQTRVKILYNIDKARFFNDPKLFKKLSENIWEFRTKYNGCNTDFWRSGTRPRKWKTLVIATNGFMKKSDKVPTSEIIRAEQYRKLFFDQKKEK